LSGLKSYDICAPKLNCQGRRNSPRCRTRMFAALVIGFPPIPALDWVRNKKALSSLTRYALSSIILTFKGVVG
jgi:hypothetical protein